MKKLRVFEAFSGVGSQRMALRNLGIEHKVVGIAEIDKYALKSYEAIHGDCPNFGDISKIDPNDLPNMDLFTYSFPCQDLSVAGKQKGLGEGTRSGLLYECEKVIEAKRPKYLLLENVKNLVGKKFKNEFDKWLEYLEGLGYKNYWKVLNAKNYGVPQNRERVFVVSILNDNKEYEFPKPIQLDKSIKDVLENEVDEKFYYNKPFRLASKNDKLNNKNAIALFENNNFKHSQAIQNINKECPCLTARDYKDPQRILVRNNSDKLINIMNNKGYLKDIITPCDSTIMKPKPLTVSNCITARYDAGIQNKQSIGVAIIEKILIPQATKKGFIEMEIGGVCDLSYPNSKTRRGRVQENGTISPTLTASQQDICKIESNYRVRKLTPLECWRLMSFTDEDFYKAKNSGLSNSQLYKQAGNSIVVKVLEGIFSQLFLNEKTEELKVDTDFRNDGNEQFKWIV